MGDMETLLDVRDLSIVLGQRTILDRVGFPVRRGDFLAVVGESGSGKTTLSRAIIGLLAPELKVACGTIELAGLDLLRISESEFTRLRGSLIGFIPQDPATSLNPTKTVGSQLSEVFRLHPDPRLRGRAIRDRCIALLEQVGIDRPGDRLRQYPHQLSGGQKQRVLIAMAFARDPQLLIVDEPTSALDMTVQRQVMAVFDRLVAERGTTVIFVTHDIALAADHASRLLVLRGGRLIETGAVADILRRPTSGYTRSLLSGQRGTPPMKGLPTGGSAILEVDRLVVRFGNARNQAHGAGMPAVDDVSFAVRQGSTFALVGESGSGKTTIARVILGLEHPVSGGVRLNGRDITRLGLAGRRAVWRDIQFVHQNPDASLNPRDTVGDIIASPLRAHRIGTARERSARVGELLERTGLPTETISKRPAALSGGQRQRVAIARALALRAQILILDEALSALDVLTQVQILDLLRRLRRELSLSLIFISHDLTLVRQFADHVGVMHKGRLVESGAVDAVFDAPSSPYTQELLSARPGLRHHANAA